MPMPMLNGKIKHTRNGDLFLFEETLDICIQVKFSAVAYMKRGERSSS